MKLLLRLFLISISVIFFLYGYSTSIYGITLLGVGLLFTAALVYALEYWKQFFLVAIFLLTFSMFLLSRPIIRALLQTKNWIFPAPETNNFVLLLLYLGISAIILGMMFYNLLLKNSTRVAPGNRTQVAPDSTTPIFPTEYRQAIQETVLAIFSIGWLCELYLGYEKIHFMIGRDYVEFFKEYTEMAPLPIRTLATFEPYALCVLLALKPRKKTTIVLLAMYILTQLPTLLIGLRGRFMFAVLFAFCYFLIRATIDKQEVWIGKGTKILIVLAMPFVIVALNLINYARSGLVNKNSGFLSQIMDFLDKQGVSYFTLAYGYRTYPYLGDSFHNYTFGPIIDYFYRGPIGQLIFGTTPLPSVNSEELALNGNSFAHILSYHNHPNYLGGEGYGSSYLLELFADFGWLGVIIGGILITLYLAYIPRIVVSNRLILSSLAIYSLTQIFWLPRSSVTGWMLFIVTPQFWMFSIIVLLGAASWLQYQKSYKISNAHNKKGKGNAVFGQ